MSEQEASPSPEHKTLTVQQALDLGVQHQIAGRLHEAEGIYQQILHTDPNQPIALHLLGVIAHQVENYDTAVDLINKAIAINPDYAEAHNNLGNALQELGRLDEAVASYNKAIAIKPDYAMAHNNLGNALKELGRLDEAVANYNKALAIKPDFAEAHNNLGVVFNELGRLDEAVASYHKAIAIQPNYAEAHTNLGVALQKLGKLDEAVTSHHKALAIQPDYAEVHSNLGNALQELDKLDEAVESYSKALAIKPDLAEAHCNLGTVFNELGQLEEAVISYHKALAIKPDYTDARYNLSIVLQDLGRLDEAVASYNKTLATKPDLAKAHYNLGNALKEQGKLDEAVASYNKALAIEPDLAEVLVEFAINSWVHAEQDECIDRINTLSNIYRKSFIGDPSTASYYVLLKKLIDYKADHPQEYELSENLPPLFALGESHCLSPAHTTVYLNGTQYRVEPKIISGCRAWHLRDTHNNKGDTHYNKYKIEFEKISDSFASGATAVVMFGEIDCRPNVGILPHHKKTGNDLPKYICELVQSYVEYVTNVFGPRGITPIFYGIPARITRKTALPLDDEAMSSYVIGKFNQVLAKETKKRNIPFLDIYSLTNDADGQSSGEFYIDTIHLFPSSFGHLTKQL